MLRIFADILFKERNRRKGNDPVSEASRLVTQPKLLRSFNGRDLGTARMAIYFLALPKDYPKNYNFPRYMCYRGKNLALSVWQAMYINEYS